MAARGGGVLLLEESEVSEGGGCGVLLAGRGAGTVVRGNTLRGNAKARPPDPVPDPVPDSPPPADHLPAISPSSPHHLPSISPPSSYYLPTISAPSPHHLPTISKAGVQLSEGGSQGQAQGQAQGQGALVEDNTLIDGRGEHSN